jgi:hypothetical protein
VGTWHDPDVGRPIAAPLERCAELLGGVVQALDTRLTLALHVAEEITRAELNPRNRVF